ncbi:MAG: hypothetical protein J6D46_00360 [Lachnospiraceae bacterium]|nr:hypothetical protein [Lachnospiraceae bacterium]
MEKLTDGIKTLLLAGLGAAALTADKSRELLEDLVQRGELTVEQGKALNQELKHRMASAGEKAAKKAVPETRKVDNDELSFTPEGTPSDQTEPAAESVENLLSGSLSEKLTEEELASLKALLKKGGAL